MRRTTRCVFTVSVVLLFSASASQAQVTGSARPYRGVFGGGHDIAARHSLDVSAQLGQAYDDDVYADSGGQITPGTKLDGGYFTDVLTTGAYTWKRSRVQIAANAAGTWRHYQDRDVPGIRVIGTTAGFGASALIAPRTRLFANQSIAYSPSYLYGLFPAVAAPAPGDQIPASPDYRVDVSDSYAYGTTVSITRGLSPRNSIGFSGDYTYTDVLRESLNRRDASAYGLRGDFSRNLSRRVAVRVGYRYKTGDIGYVAAQTGQATVEHGADAGMDYTKILSATRQAVFRFNFGTSSIELPPGVNPALAGRLYRAIGDATVGYQFGRSWQVRAVYRRGLDYVTELSQPVFSDGYSAVVEGLVTRRLGLTVSGNYSSGQAALYENASPYDTYTGNIKIRYAVSQMWAASIDYLYYYYDFRGTLLLHAGVPPALERTGLRAGLTLWMPLVRK
jgi:hypothetical protein